jgi:lysophospholipase L1-like esterase
MKKVFTLFVLFITFTTFAQSNEFEGEIKSFRTQDSIKAPQEGIILFIGSSSFRLWKTAKEDFNNPKIVNRAFGGATLEDVIYYQDDVVLKYNPKKIFLYCGENDIASSENISAVNVLERFQKLYETMRAKFPETQIVFISIKPSILRWSMRDRMMEANKLIQSYITGQKNTFYVDIWDKMLENGVPKKDIFLDDNLHMNAKGYAIWKKEMEPFIK